MTISPLGDSALVVEFARATDAVALARARALAATLSRELPPGAVDVVAAFGQLAVYYARPRADAAEVLRQKITACLEFLAGDFSSAPARTVEIPVCYGGEHGPDLDAVAAHTALAPAEVVALHAGAEYCVNAIGFAPGFAYLGGLPAALAMPRRATPRPRVRAGSVGIGGAQTGAYPQASPGGWNLIGRTPLALFDPARAEPALLRTGDRVRFRPLSPAEFPLAAEPAPGKLTCNAMRYKQAEAPMENGAGEGGAICNAMRDKPAAVRVVRAGMLTTVQDLGRTGHRAAGVPLGGAMDALAARVANLLVGNVEEAATLECTLLGPTLEFSAAVRVAIGGAEFEGAPTWRAFTVRAGETLRLGAARRGCRGYLAVEGGFDLPPVLGSRATNLRAGFGGLEGRALRDGDWLPVGRTTRGNRPATDSPMIDPRMLPAYSAAPTVRVVRGAVFAEFEAAAFFGGEFKVLAQSDRMGVRLAGPPLGRTTAAELASAPVAPGTVQVPPDGRPIVLMADAQTLGGYPRIAHVITTDLPLVAQLRPGEALRFREVTLAEAGEAALARERALGMLREGLAQALR